MATQRKLSRPARARGERVVRGSGNVFADLGFRNADDLQMRGRLIFQINAIIRERKLTQVAAAEVLGIDQADVSRLLNGEFIHRFTTERLLRLLNRLDHDVEIVIKPKARARAHTHVVIATPG